MAREYSVSKDSRLRKWKFDFEQSEASENSASTGISQNIYDIFGLGIVLWMTVRPTFVRYVDHVRTARGKPANAKRSTNRKQQPSTVPNRSSGKLYAQ